MTDSFRVLETVFRRAGLGVRPLDVATGEPLGARHRSWCQPLESDAAPTPGRRSSAGVHAFANLPGLAGWEFPPIASGAPDSIPEPATPVGPIRFGAVLEPRSVDVLPIAVAVDLPRTGPVDVPAFSAPGRSAPAGFTAVRGDLRSGAFGADPLTWTPIPWALVELRPAGEPDGGEAYFGLSEGSGAFCVLLPTPDPLSGPDGSSALVDRRVPFELRVFFEAAAQSFLVRGADGRTSEVAGATAGQTVGALQSGQRAYPIVESLTSQALRDIVSSAGAPQESLAVNLPFAPEAVVQSIDDSPFVLLASA